MLASHAGEYTLVPGQAEPIGPSYLPGIGVNFAVESTYATAAKVLIWDSPTADQPSHEFELVKSHVTFPDGLQDDVWHGLVVGLSPDPVVYYTLRMDGPNDPENGHRFNPEEDLIDPGCLGTTGSFRWVDGKKIAPKCIIDDGCEIDWEGFDGRICRPSAQTIIAEVHPAGITRALSDELGPLAGTFAGFTERLDYPIGLCTAIEIMPPLQFQTQEGRWVNDWGYSSLGAFAALHADYFADPNHGTRRREAKIFVREAHRHELEVILDIVYNHTAEGNENGPLMCFRGIDNAVYYFLKPFRNQHYLNWSGCGNTVHCNSDRMIRMIIRTMKSLVAEYKIDGFRFDLGKVFRKVLRSFALEQLEGNEEGLRELEAYLDGSHHFFSSSNPDDIVNRFVRSLHDYVVGGYEVFESQLMLAMENAVLHDEVLKGIKIIAEPWDCTGNVSGNFGQRIWAEWYDRMRKSINEFWAGKPGQAGGLLHSMDGARDQFPRGPNFRMPVGYFACHDGSTGLDTCMYEERHNERNGEENQDGPTPEGSNCGAEGATDDPYIIRLRWQMLKNKFATLLLSFVMPMLLLGDELGWSKGGNNNTWCQPELNNFPWHLVPGNSMARFVRLMVAFRQRYEIGGREVDGNRVDRKIVGHGVKPLAFDHGYYRSFVAGEILPFAGEEGSHIYFAANASVVPVHIEELPDPPAGQSWFRFVDTSCPDGQEIADTDEDMPRQDSNDYWVQRHSTIILVSR